MSSRTLAAAKARRAGENAPPISGSIPRTSIGSHAAFVPSGYHTQLPAPNSNIRVAKTNVQPPPPSSSRSYRQSPQSQQSPQNQPSNGLPFSKLSISDAIGLITLRLGRVEQWLIDNDHDGERTMDKELSSSAKMMDQSVLSGLLERLENIEKREPSSLTSLDIQDMKEDVQKITDSIVLIQKENNRQSVLISKMSEKLLRYERDMVDIKDSLKTFMMKYDMYVNEMNDRFRDFEEAMVELEKTNANVATTFIDNLPVETTQEPAQESTQEPAQEPLDDNIQVHIDEFTNLTNLTNIVNLKSVIESALG